MVANKRGTLPVSGVCKRCGTTVAGSAPKGRVTLRCICPKPGCGAAVIARRAVPGKHGGPKHDGPQDPSPQDPGAPAASSSTTSSSTKPRKRKRAPRVDYDREHTPRPEQGPDRPAEGEDPGVRPGPDHAGREHARRDGPDTRGPGAEGGRDEPGPREGVGEQRGRESWRESRAKRRLRRARYSEAGHRRAPYEFLGW